MSTSEHCWTVHTSTCHRRRWHRFRGADRHARRMVTPRGAVTSILEYSSVQNYIDRSIVCRQHFSRRVEIAKTEQFSAISTLEWVSFIPTPTCWRCLSAGLPACLTVTPPCTWYWRLFRTALRPLTDGRFRRRDGWPLGSSSTRTVECFFYAHLPQSGSTIRSSLYRSEQ